jgi:hypothetical protein
MMMAYFQKLTTEHTEKIFYYKKLTEILLPPLCVLSIIILFFPLLVFTPVKFSCSLPLGTALQKKLSTDTLLSYKARYNSSVISIKVILLENTEIPSVKLCGFILLPFFS